MKLPFFKKKEKPKSDVPMIKLRSLEAFQAAANGQATKIIIPSEISGLAGMAAGLIEAVKDPKQ